MSNTAAHSPPTTPYNTPSYQQTTSPSPPPDIGHGLAANENAVVGGTAVAGYYNQLRQLTTTGMDEIHKELLRQLCKTEVTQNKAEHPLRFEATCIAVY
jgi:hypothetical protein